MVVLRSPSWIRPDETSEKTESLSPAELSRMRRSRRWVSFALVGGAILAIAAVTVQSYRVVRGSILEGAKQQAQLQVTQANRELDTWLAEVRSLVETMAHTPQVQSGNWETMAPYLELFAARHPDLIEGGSFQLPDGVFYVTGRGLIEGRNVSDREYFQRVLQERRTVFGQPIIGRTTGQLQSNVATPVWSRPQIASDQEMTPEQIQLRQQNLAALGYPTDLDQQPELVGLWVRGMPLTRFSEVVSRTSTGLGRLGQGGYAFAIDTQATLLAHPNEQVLQEYSTEKNLLDHPDPALVSVVQTMIDTPSGTELVDLEEGAAYVAFSQLTEANWIIALVIPRHILEQQLQALNLQAGILGLLLLGGAAMALRQVQFSEKTRARAAREALLNRLTARIRASLDLNTILETAVEEVGQLLGTHRVLFGWYHPQTQTLERVSQYRSTPRITATRPFNFAALGSLGQKLAQGELVQIDSQHPLPDQEQSPEVAQAYREMGLTSLLALPVPNAGGSMGYLVCSSDSRRVWDQQEVELLLAVADQLAIAIKQSQDTQALQEAKDAAEGANRAKSSFLANMSHELRTPLNAVISYTEILQEEAEETEQEIFSTDLQRIHAAADHLLDLIDSILDLSKVEAGRMSLYPEDIDIGMLVQTIVGTVTPLAQKQGNQILVNCPAEIGLMYSDMTKLRQILFNLLSNACKFTEQGKIHLHVARRTQKGRDWILFRVRDTGIGMTPEQLHRIFEAFSQADPSTTRKYGGTGLGLTITQKFCQLMGGDIKAESTLGKGTTFTVWLPAQLQPREVQAATQLATV